MLASAARGRGPFGNEGRDDGKVPRRGLNVILLLLLHYVLFYFLIAFPFMYSEEWCLSWNMYLQILKTPVAHSINHIWGDLSQLFWYS